MSKIYQFLVGFIVIVHAVAALNYTSFVHSQNYHLSTSKAVFAQALMQCERMGWTLAVEDSAEATSALNKALNETELRVQNVWLGGVYQEISGYFGKWTWIGAGEILGYTNWQAGEPTGSSGNPCLRKNPLSLTTISGQWYANACTTAYYFVCQG